MIFTVPTDYTTKASVGWRLKVTLNSGVRQGIITVLTATSMTVLMNTDYAPNASHAPTNMAVSPMKIPLGFDFTPSRYSATIDDANDRSQAMTQNTFYNLGSLSVAVPIGLWRVGGSAIVSIVGAAAADVSQTYFGLSTSTSSFSTQDYRYSLGYANDFSSGAWGYFLASQINLAGRPLLSLASKTTYYLIETTPWTSQTITLQGATHAPTRVNFELAYL
jgi:hypothetical protein